MGSEIAGKADFGGIRYAQCWEDADVLLEALDVKPGHVCVAIASAGDNALAMLSKAPARVIALDLSRAQLACLELRVAAYRVLNHPQLLELIGSRFGTQRLRYYRFCRAHLSAGARQKR
jgi:S-adenosylmethionine-diacylglycerol 3-amino-3-carboxypropyl transferase